MVFQPIADRVAHMRLSCATVTKFRTGPFMTSAYRRQTVNVNAPHARGVDVFRIAGRRAAGCYFATCFSLSSSRVLQSMQRVAVGLASRRFRPISMPQLSQ